MKTRLLYIGNKLSKSGSTATLIETLGNFLKKEGYKVKSVSNIQNKGLRLLDMLWQTFVNRNKIDVVLIDTYSTQNFYYAVAVAKTCRFFKIPYIPILSGGNLPVRLKTNLKLSKKLFEKAKINIAPSNYLFEAFKKEGYTNLSYIPNTIEIKNYPFKSRKKITLKLLWVRSFSKLYHPKLALKIVEELQNKGYHVSLCMVGPEKDGSLQECKQLSEKKQLPITFTGMLTQKEWLKLSEKYDLFINTTNFDNTPVSVIEAMALGLPVVSTNVGGLPYLIENNKTGILVNPNDKEVFVKAILDLYHHPEKAIIIAQNARQKAEKFSWEIVKKKWNEILK